MEFANDVVMLTGAGGRLGRVRARVRSPGRAAPADRPRRRPPSRRRRAWRARAARRSSRCRATSRAGQTSRPRSPRVGGGSAPSTCLVNFAGYVPVSPVLEVGEEEWDRVFAVNVKGTMLCCQAVAREMVGRGAAGRIVNISSGASTSARAGAAHYCGSKAAINMFTEVLATELGPHGIRVNAVAPGLVMDTVARKGEPVAHPTSATCWRRPRSAAPERPTISPRPCSSSPPGGAGGSRARCSS